jgi:hypothetical protein
MRELQRARAEVAHRDAGVHHPAANLQVLDARRAIVVAERNERARERRRVGDVQPPAPVRAIAERARAALGAVELVVYRIEHDADVGAAVDDVRDRHVPVRNAAQEIVRTVDRVDDPAAIERAGEGRRRFFPEKRILRPGRGDLAPKQRFDVAIGVAHEVLRSLQLDRQTVAVAPVIERNRTGLPRERLRERVAILFHAYPSVAKTCRK